MKKLLLVAALFVAGFSVQANAFFRNGCCGQRVESTCAPKKCAASCEVNRVEAEKPVCERFVRVTEEPFCKIEEIKTWHCPENTVEASCN